MLSSLLSAVRSLQLLPHLQACCMSALKMDFILRRHTVPECVWLPQDLQRNCPCIMLLRNKQQWQNARLDREAEAFPPQMRQEGIGSALCRGLD